MSDEAVATEKTSRWEDIIDVFLSPRELFERRRDDAWWKPYLIVAAIGVVLYYALINVNAQIMEAAMMQNMPEGADPEQMQKTANITKWFGGIGVPFGYLFVLALTALGLKLGSAMVEPPAGWGQVFTIAAYSLYVTIPQQLLTAVLVMLKGRSGEVGMQDMSFGVMRFMDPETNDVVAALLGRLDVFALWGAALTAIGLIVVLGMPRNRAILAAAIAWLVVAIPGVVAAAFRG